MLYYIALIMEKKVWRKMRLQIKAWYDLNCNLNLFFFGL